ncbi:NUDIX hydrolase [Streptomyces sp. N35]|uniref:NUDIX hydrolase n=1 Tax=Streptomyces sp. N35 TaxID=2795730 RepID=UPI0027DCDD1A|nr:NUDIX hydrolase [Streptomyces sp. N35]
MTETLPPAGIDLFDARRLRFSEIEPPHQSAEDVAARDRVWETAVRANPTLFDGPVVACGGIDWADPHVLDVTWARVTYRHYALRRVPGATAMGSLFVNVVQPTVDGRVAVVRMAPSTAAPGRWQLPGGSVEPPPHGSALDAANVAAQAARELSEEMGIDVSGEDLELCVVTRGENTSVGLTYLAPARPEGDLREAFATAARAERAKGLEPELAELTLVNSPDDLGELAGPHADYLAPIVARCTHTPRRQLT